VSFEYREHCFGIPWSYHPFAALPTLLQGTVDPALVFGDRSIKFMYTVKAVNKYIESDLSRGEQIEIT
jgi:hypothetical protein